MSTTRNRTKISLALSAACALPACVAGVPGEGLTGEVARAVTDAIGKPAKIFRGGQQVAWLDTIAALRDKDVVFVGEMHDDFTTHLVERALLRALVKERKVVLSLEFFSWEQQDTLDAYLRGEIDEDALQRQTGGWTNFAEAHAPLLRIARAAGVRILGANCPRALQRKVSRGKADAVAGLSTEERRLFPAQLFPAQASYWERYDRLTRLHGGRRGPPSTERLHWTQNLWDNAMGAAIARAKRDAPDVLVLHFCGAFHSDYHNGTVHQLRVRAPDLQVATVSCIPHESLEDIDGATDVDRADFVVWTRRLVADRFRASGRYSVSIPSQLSWKLARRRGATDDGPAPLLVWLTDGDARARDDQAWLHLALGTQAHVVTVDAHRVDAAGDPTWFGAGQLGTEGDRIRIGLSRLLDYLDTWLDYDRERIVVAGEGNAASMALAVARTAPKLRWRSYAHAPERVDELASQGRRPMRKHDAKHDLTVVVEDAETYRRFADIDRELGFETQLRTYPTTELNNGARIESDLRALLGLTARAPRAGKAPMLRDPSRTARVWGRAWAAATGRELAANEILDFTALERDGRSFEAALEAKDVLRIPRATSPFGGTTVLVLPEREDARGAQAWRDVVAEQKRNPRFPVQLAYEGAALDLWHALESLRDEEARAVLVIPCEFCRDLDSLRAWKREAKRRFGAWASKIAWRRGLGAVLVPDPEQQD